MTRAEFVNRWEGEFVAYDDADFLADLNALLDAEKAETELREVLSVLEGGGPATETLFALAQRGLRRRSAPCFGS